MIRLLIVWMVHRTSWWKRHPLTQWDESTRKHQVVARRFMPFFYDEIQRGDNTIYKRLPWWAPCNPLLHLWFAHDDGEFMHDHPRWSITICLKGEVTERTPWGERTLRPGSVVFRSCRYIHAFRVVPEHSGRTWTLFIVGRRKCVQNTYRVTRRTAAADRSPQPKVRPAKGTAPCAL